MHDEHHGNCCRPQDLHEHHEHHHAALPLGHICTGACMHEAAGVEALAALQQQHAMIEQLQARAYETAPKPKKDAQKKAKNKRRKLGNSSLVPLTAAS